jgi:hypothetical protein
MSFVTGIWNGIKKDFEAMGKDGSYGKDSVKEMIGLIGAHRPIGVDPNDYSEITKKLMDSSPTIRNTSLLSLKKAGTMAATGATIGAVTGGLLANDGNVGKGIAGGALGGALTLGGIRAGIGYLGSQNHLMNEATDLIKRMHPNKV